MRNSRCSTRSNSPRRRLASGPRSGLRPAKYQTVRGPTQLRRGHPKRQPVLRRPVPRRALRQWPRCRLSIADRSALRHREAAQPEPRRQQPNQTGRGEGYPSASATHQQIMLRAGLPSLASAYSGCSVPSTGVEHSTLLRGALLVRISLTLATRRRGGKTEWLRCTTRRPRLDSQLHGAPCLVPASTLVIAQNRRESQLNRPADSPTNSPATRNRDSALLQSPCVRCRADRI